MGAVQDAVNTWLRDDVVEGNPASGVNDPSKAEGRAIGGLIEQYVADRVSSSVSAGGAAKIIRDVTPETGTVGTGVLHTFRLPYGLLLSEVRASLTTDGGSATVIDITVKQTEAGSHVSILTDPLQVDAGATTSVGSTAPPLILTRELNDNAEVKIDVTSDGGGAGLKVYLNGSYAAFGVGSIPYFVACGASAGAYDSQSVATPYPAGLQEDDVVILECRTQGIAATTTPTITRPSGWTALANPVGPSGSTSGDAHSDLKSTAAWFWKRLDGTETGNVTVTASGGNGSAQGMGCRMIMFRGCVQNGDPFESAITNAGDSTTPQSTTLVTLGPNRLAANFYAINDDGESSSPDAGWTQAYDDAFSFAIGGSRRALSVAQMPVGGPTAPETRTIATKSAWSTLSLAFVPATS